MSYFRKVLVCEVMVVTPGRGRYMSAAAVSWVEVRYPNDIIMTTIRNAMTPGDATSSYYSSYWRKYQDGMGFCLFPHHPFWKDSWRPRKNRLAFSFDINMT